MDKKRTIKIVLAVCFVIVCGLFYLVLCSPFGKRDEIVFEKQSGVLQSEIGTKEGEEFPALQENTDEADGEYHGENSAESGTVEAILYVHICGAVLEEGVYALPMGSRVTDGIDAAGGFREDADVAFHNLAALLTDGQKIYVPTVEETEVLSLPERTESSLYGGMGVYGSGVGTKVNLNTAGLAELMTLNGIGEAKAESILKYREKVGRFQSIEELKKVSGIGDAMFERIQEDIVVE
jgi:competence protein ComEA